MRYAASRYSREQSELTRDLYIAEALRQQGRGFYLTESLIDVLGIRRDDADDRSAEDIIDDIAERLGAQ